MEEVPTDVAHLSAVHSRKDACGNEWGTADQVTIV